MRPFLAALALITACVPDQPKRTTDRDVDAAVAGDDAPPDASCATPTTYYADKDHDGHGDPDAPVQACAQPPDTALAGDDCDDTNAAVHPGAVEACDALDNDCNPATAETQACPVGCTAVRRPPPDDAHVYLFCENATNWNAARTICNAGGFALVEIDSAAENAWIRQEANVRLGTGELHIGASDAITEGTWQWDGGDVFWQGNQNGQPVNNHFAAWAAGQEPNGSDDCAELRVDNAWYDNNCGDNQRYVCRK